MLLAGALLLAACGDSDDSGGGDSDSSSASIPSITIGLPQTVAGSAQPYIAQKMGYFEEAGVNVKIITNVSSNMLNLLATKQIDVAFYSGASTFSLSQQGKEVSMIYSFTSGGSAAAVVSKPNLNSVMDLSGQRVGVRGTDGAAPGALKRYTEYIVAHGGKAPTAVNFGTISDLANALHSGNIVAGVGAVAQFGDEVQTGKAKVLVDTGDPQQRNTFFGGSYLEGVSTGLKDVLGEKHDAIVRFLQGVARANRWMITEPADTVSKLLDTIPDFKTTPPDVELANVQAAKHYITPEDGRITPQLWADSLDMFKLSVAPNVEVNTSYEAMVDMSFLDEAQKLIK